MIPRLHPRLAGALGLTLSALAACAPADSSAEHSDDPPAADIAPESSELAERAAALEQEVGGRIGVAMVDGEGAVIDSYRGEERFAMCSTFKLPLAAMMLERAVGDDPALDEVLPYDESDLLDYAPSAREHVAAGGMTVRDLAEAAVIVSDNTAANLLLERTGGPAGLTDFFRRHGDSATRLDRTEPALNENAPGDERDTTTPEAMATLIQRLALGDGLPVGARDQLQEWAVANRTGDNRIRAGIPAGWRVGDKTGSCGNASNDVGIVWPPEGEPFVLAVYIDRPTAEASAVDGVFAELAGVAAAEAAGTGN
ncbi:class A beta-lactamase [Gaopeijia maritima]|uniref:class A beta-lactamase n=1 Tax=Gaopeijia maritima TaxID=3119007 RepID=UPI003866950F